MRPINLIVIHCSDSDVKAHDDISVIKDWHLKRGFDDVGYHFFIKKSGDVQKGRPISIPGAHVEGHNKTSIGICMAGKRLFTDAQFKSAIKLCSELITEYDLDMYDIVGHRDLNEHKTCPNFDVFEKISINVKEFD